MLGCAEGAGMLIAFVRLISGRQPALRL